MLQILIEYETNLNSGWSEGQHARKVFQHGELQTFELFVRKLRVINFAAMSVHFSISSQVTFHSATDILMNFLVSLAPLFPIFFSPAQRNAHVKFIFFNFSISIRLAGKRGKSFSCSAFCLPEGTFKYSSSNNKSSATEFCCFHATFCSSKF